MPAYNEADRIEANVLEAWGTLREFPLEFELLIVDDGSVDDTALCALSASQLDPKRIRVIRSDRNQGKGSAVICGTRYASGDYVAFLDADLDLHPRQLKTFIDVMCDEQTDLVIGSKFHPHSVVDYPPIRRVYSFGYYAVIRLLFGLPVKDTQTGIKLFKIDVLRRVLPRVLVKRFAFDIELLVNATALGYKISEAPVTLHFQRSIGGRINFRDAWHILIDTLAIFYRARIIRYYDHVRPVPMADLPAVAHADLLALPPAPERDLVTLRA